MRLRAAGTRKAGPGSGTRPGKGLERVRYADRLEECKGEGEYPNPVTRAGRSQGPSSRDPTQAARQRSGDREGEDGGYGGHEPEREEREPPDEAGAQRGPAQDARQDAPVVRDERRGETRQRDQVTEPDDREHPEGEGDAPSQRDPRRAVRHGVNDNPAEPIGVNRNGRRRRPETRARRLIWSALSSGADEHRLLNHRSRTIASRRTAPGRTAASAGRRSRSRRCGCRRRCRSARRPA